MIYPTTLLIETTNRCNASCVICARRWGLQESHDMSLELYKGIIDSCLWVDNVSTHLYGEPLMDPNILEAVKYAKEKGKYVWMTTNASLLSSEMAIALLEIGLDKIIFSVDADEKTTYEILRVGLKWEDVLQNIENFQKLRNDGNYKTRTILNIVSSKENLSQIKRIFSFWEKRVDGVAVTPEVDVSPPIAKWVKASEPVECERIFKHMTIRANGDMVLCCRDCHSTYIMGNVNEELPIKIFNSWNFNQIRRKINTGRNIPAICVDCHVKPPKRP